MVLRLALTLLVLVAALSGGPLLAGHRTFDDHAAQAVRTSGAARLWHEGFVPVESVTRMPPAVAKRIRSDEEWGWIADHRGHLRPGDGRAWRRDRPRGRPLRERYRPDRAEYTPSDLP